MIGLALALVASPVQAGILFDKHTTDIGRWRLTTADYRKTGKRYLGLMAFYDSSSTVTITVQRLDSRTISYGFDAPRCGLEASLSSNARAERHGMVSVDMRHQLTEGLKRLAALCPFTLSHIEKDALQDMSTAWSRLDVAENN